MKADLLATSWSRPSVLPAIFNMILDCSALTALIRSNWTGKCTRTDERTITKRFGRSDYNVVVLKSTDLVLLLYVNEVFAEATPTAS